MKEGTVVNATETPITVKSLVEDFRKLGVQSGMTLLVHSSLSSLGWVCGGAVAVVMALEEVLGAEGTLVMPTHTSSLGNPQKWVNPPVPESWWSIIREETPAFDPLQTPSSRMGIIPEHFRTQQKTLRSSHPLSSFAASGPHAALITQLHPLESAVGQGSPVEVLYNLNAKVLLLGVGHCNNTSLHLAECRADYASKMKVEEGAPILVNGERQWAKFESIDWNDSDFEQLGAAFEEAAKEDEVRIGKVGNATSRLLSQPACVDFGVKWIEANRR